jgi:alpha-glucosidase
MLTLYRRALALRAAHPALGSGEATVSTDGDVLTVRSVGGDQTVRCVVNMGSGTALVGGSGSVLLSSATRLHRSGGSVALPPDTAVWLAEDCGPVTTSERRRRPEPRGRPPWRRS